MEGRNYTSDSAKEELSFFFKLGILGTPGFDPAGAKKKPISALTEEVPPLIWRKY